MAGTRRNLAICLLIIGYAAATPVIGAGICLEDTSGAVYNLELVEGTTLLQGTIEVPGLCPTGPLYGAWALSDTPGLFEVGFWTHYNTLSTDCTPQISFSGTLDGSLHGEGVLTFVGTFEGVICGAVSIGPCGSLKTMAEENSVAPWSWWKQ